MPSEPTEHPKLAAFLFTDIVGYPITSEAPRNEALALDAVPEGRPIIAQRFTAGLGAQERKVPQGRKNGRQGRRRVVRC